MSNEYLLVDGYNIVFSWNNLKKISDSSLEDARIKLINIMSNYQGFKGINVILVFDAHLVKGNKGSIEKHDNIFVVYTREAETADNYIEKTANSIDKKYKVRVATSDRLEQIIIMGKGATRISARELKKEVDSVNKKISKHIDKQKPIKNNMLINNIDSYSGQWLENLRKSKGG